jgi:hypothetical protein
MAATAKALLITAVLAALAGPAMADSTTVAGVTVKGKHEAPPKCAANDKDCVLTVAKILWAQYPEQTQRYCIQEQNRAWTTRMNLQAMPSNDPAGNDNGRSSQVAPSLKVVCDYVADQVKAQKAAAKATQP